MSGNGTLADRNNNPGNIKASPHNNWLGEGEPNGGFESFQTPEHGVRAMAKNLYTYNERDGLNTVGGIISQWAPPSENDTDAYIDFVADEMGVGANDDLGTLRGNPHVTSELITAMATYEGASTGPAGQYTKKVVDNGVAMANGKSEDEIDFEEQPTNFDPEALHGYGPDQGHVDDADNFVGVDSADVDRVIELATIKNNVTPNWLSTVDSPTYRWSLYIVNNQIWNEPNLIGNDDAALNNSQAFIIAKQGVETEFSIDNFMSLARITPGQRHGNATPGVIQFDLFETLGFTFMDKMLSAGKALGKPANLYSQNFILKLEFLGRDPVTGGSVPFPGVFVYPVKLNQIRSTTGPEGTRYNIIAWSALKHAQTESVTDVPVTVENIITIEDFMKNFENAYNQSQKDLMNPGDRDKLLPSKQIKIVFDESTHQRPHGNHKINGKSLDWFHLPSKAYAGTSNIGDSTRTGQSTGPAGSNINPDSNTTVVEAETNIQMALEKNITNNCPAWNEWVLEASKYGNTPHIVVEANTSYPLIISGAKSVAPLYGNVEPILVTYTIKIAYNVTTYDASISDGNDKLNDTTHQTKRFKELPIEKSYTYLYSGLNTEVINYQLDVQNLFFVIDQPGSATYVSGKDSQGQQQFAPGEITDSLFISDIKQSSVELGYFNPVVGSVAKPNSPAEGKLNEFTYSSDSAIARRLQDMAKREFDALNFNMEIKGDPHWMGNMQAVVQGKLEEINHSKQDALISFLQFNPNADKLLTEQIKGEIDPISTGIYKLVTVESRFQGGRFTQTLQGYKDVNSNTSLLIPNIIELSGV